MRNFTRIYPRVLVPLFFMGHERMELDEALKEIRIEADEDEADPILDGRAIEYLCADWLARWGA